MNNYAIAKSYHDAGYTIVPLRCDGSKSPLIEWKERNWSSLERYFVATAGIGILCGHRSGGLEVLDYDQPEAYDEWYSLLDASLQSVVDTLPLIATPSDGKHLYFRTESALGNIVLARCTDGTIYIETRGEGGMVVAAGSPVSVHSLCVPYRLIGGDPRHPPLITTEQRTGLYEVARKLNRYNAPQCTTTAPKRKKHTGGRGWSVSDRYNDTANWEDILPASGWVIARVKGGVTYWTKPDGKRGDIHATTGWGNADCFHCFTTACPPFDADKNYKKFAVYTLLNHNGDYTAAARTIKTTLF